MIESLPEHIQAALNAWCRELEGALADSLVGVLVYGDVPRGSYRVDQSDIDAVVVLTEANFAALESIADAFQRARYRARVEAMILLEREIAGASDCFPLLYDDIKTSRFLLTGRDPFVGVVVHDTHRRLRIEQELREAHIGLRRDVTDALGAAEAIAGAVERKASRVREALHSLLALKDIACAPDLNSVLARSAQAWSIDLSALALPRERPSQAHGALTALLSRAIEDANAMVFASRRPPPPPP